MTGSGSRAPAPSPSPGPPGAPPRQPAPDDSAPDDSAPDDAARDEAALPESALRAAGVGTYRWDPDAGTVTLDARARGLLGLAGAGDGPLARADVLARVHPHDVGTVVAAADAALATGEPYEALYRVVRDDGSERWVVERGGPAVPSREPGAAPRPRGAARPVVGVVQDATASRGEDARLVRIVESAPAGFFSMDLDGTLTYVNAQAERLLGRPRAQLLGRHVRDAFPHVGDGRLAEQYREAMLSAEARSFDAYYPPPLDAWFEVRAVPGPDGVAFYLADVTERRREQDRADLLAAVTAELAGTMDAERAVARLARLVVPALADWCIVSLVDDDTPTGARRGLRDVAGWHRDEAHRPAVHRYAEVRLAALRTVSFFGRAADTGSEVSLDAGATPAILDVLRPGEARDLLAVLAPDSFTVLPLRGRDGVVGLLTLFNGPDRPPITARDRETAREVAARAGVALETARLYRQQRNLAEGLQRALLTAPPEPDHGQIAVRYVPSARAAQVGGDWYDAFMQSCGATTLVIGDVAGHDTAAAAAMGQVRSLLRGIAVATEAAPADLLTQVDRAMRTLQVDTLATAVVARLEQTPAERREGVTRVRWANAGHPPPLVVDPDGAVHELESPGGSGPLLGVVPDVARSDSQAVLARGSTLLLYTDGLVESREVPLDLGIAALRDAVADLASRDLDLESLCDGVLSRMVPAHHEDDVALVAIRLHRQDGPRPAEAGPGRVPPDVPPEPGDGAEPDRR